MAHFVDGKKYVRISGQRVHVPIGRPVTIGLWGGTEGNGKRLEVVPKDKSILRVKGAPKRGDISMFTLTAVKIGETDLDAIASDGAAWDTVEAHVHMPRNKQLPNWTSLYDNYAGDEEESDAFRVRVGGAVDNPDYGNTCVLRMSEAFNKAGHPIPKNRAGLYTVKGGDGANYAMRVREFKPYLQSAYGTPDIVRTPPKNLKVGVLRDDFVGLRGVLCFEVSFSDATGHFTLWDGTWAVHGDYFDRAHRVSLWLTE